MKSLTIICIFLISVVSMQAFDDTYGLREYKENCRACHGTPYKGSTMLTTSEWISMFANSNEKLIAAHSKDQKALEVMRSESFASDSKKLIEFLKNNSQDSGRVRGCNGTSCG